MFLTNTCTREQRAFNQQPNDALLIRLETPHDTDAAIGEIPHSVRNTLDNNIKTSASLKSDYSLQSTPIP